MGDIYMVDCCIDDGMKGENYMLGIYDSFDLAKQEIKKFLKNLPCQYVNLNKYSYEVQTKNFHFELYIHKVTINETTIPSLFKTMNIHP